MQVPWTYQDTKYASKQKPKKKKNRFHLQNYQPNRFLSNPQIFQHYSTSSLKVMMKDSVSNISMHIDFTLLYALNSAMQQYCFHLPSHAVFVMSRKPEQCKTHSSCLSGPNDLITGRDLLTVHCVRNQPDTAAHPAHHVGNSASKRNTKQSHSQLQGLCLAAAWF